MGLVRRRGPSFLPHNKGGLYPSDESVDEEFQARACQV